MRRQVHVAAALALLAVASSVPLAREAFAKEKQLKVATGGEKGTYHTIGTSLKLVQPKETKFEVLTSAGSAENVSLVSFGAADLALVQLDYLAALAGRGDYERISKRVLVVAPLYHEEVHILVKKGSIGSLKQLEKKTIGVGQGATGHFFSATFILQAAAGLDYEKEDVLIDASPMPDAIAKLAAGELGAVFFTGGTPVKLLSELDPAVADKVELLPLSDDEITKLTATHLPYIETKIEPGTYRWQKTAVRAVATPCVLVAGEKTDAQVIRDLAYKIFLNLERLSQEHAKWKQADKQRAKLLLAQGRFTFHPGAIQYYGEK